MNVKCDAGTDALCGGYRSYSGVVGREVRSARRGFRRCPLLGCIQVRHHVFQRCFVGRKVSQQARNLCHQIDVVKLVVKFILFWDVLFN